jgi:ribosome modulation factor
MSNDRKQIVQRLREEGYQAGLAGRPLNANPHRFMDAYQWAIGHEQGAKEKARIEEVAAEFTREGE